MKSILSVLLALSWPTLLPAMDRFDALSQLESRNNDHAIGKRQEVSRFQILPEFWAQATAGNKQATQLFRPTDPNAAKAVVNWIMEGRCRTFAERYHRAPTDFEYYILWHRPACLIGRTVPRHLTLAETDRGRRFASLCQSAD
jgi:hypothetical protein